MSAVETWQSVVRELDLWQDRGLRAKFWVRDDDAHEMSPQLAHLHHFADVHNIKIGLAVIPGRMNTDFADVLAGMRNRFHPMCHGWTHADYGPPGKPGEFGDDRPFSNLCSDAERAYAAFSGYFGSIPVIFVPPNGRITPALREALPRIGFAAVSTGRSDLEHKVFRMSSFLPWMPAVTITDSAAPPRLDVHIDVIDWNRKMARDSKSVATEIVDNLRFRRRGFLRAHRPIGLLTHHLVHDDKIWQLCNELLDTLFAHKAVDFVAADALFEAYDYAPPSVTYVRTDMAAGGHV